MAHFACVSLPYLGHLNPMIALAQELKRRGHAVTLLHMPDAGVAPKRAGLDFLAVGKRTHHKGWLDGAKRNCGRVTGVFGLGSVIRDFASMTAMLCDELPPAVRDLSVDMIIADQYEPAGGMVAYRLGLPFVSLAAALPLNWEIGVPSPFIAWSFGETRWHRYRNIVSAFGARKIRGPIDDVVARFAAQWGLGSGSHIEDYMSGFAQISQLIPPLDFPRRSLIGCFHYCGPLRNKVESDPRPARRAKRAFATLGTLQGHRFRLFEKIAAAARACGLELTIAHGGGLSRTEVQSLSRHAEVHEFVCHERMLADADVAILHGGLNSTLDALAHGVPVVLLPLAYEQRAIATRVVRSGAGRVCRPQMLSSRRLAQQIKHVCETPSYAASAAGLRGEIKAAGGTGRAADIVEYVVETGRPCLNSNLVH